MIVYMVPYFAFEAGHRFAPVRDQFGNFGHPLGFKVFVLKIYLGFRLEVFFSFVDHVLLDKFMFFYSLLILNNFISIVNLLIRFNTCRILSAWPQTCDPNPLRPH